MVGFSSYCLFLEVLRYECKEVIKKEKKEEKEGRKEGETEVGGR